MTKAALPGAELAVPSPFPDAELRLYALLATAHGTAEHTTYNALVRRMRAQIEPELCRFPASDPPSFRTAVDAVIRP